MNLWRCVSAAGDRTAWFFAVMLIAVTANCSGGAWREHGKIMGCSVDSMWGDIGIT
jgi:hypothetical protein